MLKRGITLKTQKKIKRLDKLYFVKNKGLNKITDLKQINN